MLYKQQPLKGKSDITAVYCSQKSINKSTEAKPKDANHSLAGKTGMQYWNLPKGTDTSHEIFLESLIA